MKKNKLACFTVVIGSVSSCAFAQQNFLINFDTTENWTAGSVALGSYALNHVYAENGWNFTGGPALRQGTAAQDSVAGAFGTYAWRLNQNTNVSWTATYGEALASDEYFSGFTFDARRWDGSPATAVTVAYSFDGGANFTVASSIGSSGVLDLAGFNSSSSWVSFSQSVGGTVGLAADQFVVRFSATTGERIMIDNFGASTSISAVPEPSAYAAILGAIALAGVATRRRRA